MNVLYVRKEKKDRVGDDTEGHIETALELLGHTIQTLDENSPRDLAKASGFDLLLFHHSGQKLLPFLDGVKAKKALWYFDKTWYGRDQVLDAVMEKVDVGFFTDGDYVLKGPKRVWLRQGVGMENVHLGSHKEHYKTDVAFFGSEYGERKVFCDKLRRRFNFKTFQGLHGKELADAIASSKVVVAPAFPSTDRYWSNRIYLMLGAGACLVHPELKGLELDYEVNKHYAGYQSEDMLYPLIEYLLENPADRLKLSITGQVHTSRHHTMYHRVKDLMNYVQTNL